MAIASLQSLFLKTLKDISYVEKKLVKTLPKMVKKAASPELKEAINSHLAETETHVRRVEEILSVLDRSPWPRSAKRWKG